MCLTETGRKGWVGERKRDIDWERLRFYCVGPTDYIQVIRLGSKCFYLLAKPSHRPTRLLLSLIQKGYSLFSSPKDSFMFKLHSHLFLRMTETESYSVTDTG